MRSNRAATDYWDFGLAENSLHESMPHAMLDLRTVQCPYCGESFETNVDPSGGNQEYIEDCYVCCRPIAFRVETDADGNLSALETRREED